jgi:hypothetical protein
MTTDGTNASVRLRPVDLAMIAGTATAMLVAVVLRFVAAVDGGSLFGHRLAPRPLGTRYVDVRPDLDDVGLANWASGAAGIGVLLLATTLVVIAVGPWGRQFAMIVGGTAVVISLAAVVVALLATRTVDPEAAFRLGTWRTGLAAIAGACLPAVFAAAVRATARKTL